MGVSLLLLKVGFPRNRADVKKGRLDDFITHCSENASAGCGVVKSLQPRRGKNEFSERVHHGPCRATAETPASHQVAEDRPKGKSKPEPFLGSPWERRGRAGTQVRTVS